MSGPELWAGAVVVDDERLLVVRRTEPPEAGLWSVPATAVTTGEALVAAVVRAVEEMAGLEAVCEGLLGPVEHLAGGRHRVLLAYEASVLAEAPLAPAAAWVGLGEVTDRPLVDGVPQLLADHGILRLFV